MASPIPERETLSPTAERLSVSHIVFIVMMLLIPFAQACFTYFAICVAKGLDIKGSPFISFWVRLLSRPKGQEGRGVAEKGEGGEKLPTKKRPATGGIVPPHLTQAIEEHRATKQGQKETPRRQRSTTTRPSKLATFLVTIYLVLAPLRILLGEALRYMLLTYALTRTLVSVDLDTAELLDLINPFRTNLARLAFLSLLLVPYKWFPNWAYSRYPKTSVVGLFIWEQALMRMFGATRFMMIDGIIVSRSSPFNLGGGTTWTWWIWTGLLRTVVFNWWMTAWMRAA